MTQEIPLPDGWKLTTVGNLVLNKKNSIKRGPFGSSVKKVYFVPSGYKIYEQQNVIHQDFSLGNYYIDETRFRELQDFQITPGDLLITGAGTIGKVAVVPDNIEPGIINQALLKLSLDRELVNINFFIYYFEVKLREFLLAKTRGSAMQNISSVSDLRVLEVPLPPLPEQERIVAKIEALFTQLEAGTAAMRRVQAGLKRYKASVLKAACEGRLVAQDPSDEPAEELLHHLGKSPQVGVAFPPLPEGWCWAKMYDVARKITDRTHFTPTYIPDGVAFISVKDIYGGKIHFDKCKYINQDEHNQLIRRCHPEPLDVLITKSGTIGRIAVVKTDRPFSLFVSVALIKQLREVWDSNYLAIALENYINHLDIQQDVKGGVIKNLHIEDIKEIILPLPPLAEQRCIVAEVERRLSVAQEIEAVVEASLARAGRLRQAILKRAFEGRLV